MIDVTSQLVVSELRRVDWSPDRALDGARAVSARVRGYTDWDEDAGEGWIRILVGTEVLALVSVAVPIGFIREKSNEGLDLSMSGLDLIAVPHIDARVLTCTRDAIAEAFGESAASCLALDVRGFSAEELWFATVS